MISILLPIYNGIEFINESVSTLIYQTYNRLGANYWNKWTSKRF